MLFRRVSLLRGVVSPAVYPKVSVLVVSALATLRAILHDRKRSLDRPRSTLEADGVVSASASTRKGNATHEGRNHEQGFGNGLGHLAPTASALRLVVLLKIVMSSAGDPSARVDFPPVLPNRCSDYDLSGFTKAAICGSPLSWPCFDFSRCRNGPTVYVYDSECSLADSDQIHSGAVDGALRQAAKDMGVLANTYESACFFINKDAAEPQCATTAPLWNEGRNHVMWDFFDGSRVERPSYSGSYAIEAATSQHTCYFRSGYDISIGHVPRAVFHELQSTTPDHRRYFLTFRGTLHIRYHGSEERESVRSLHDDAAGIIVAEKCPDKHSTYYPEFDEACAEIQPRYDAYDYELLMNSTFALVPAGASPGTYRLGEAMSAGCIPVIVARDYVKPLTELVDWSEFSFTFSPDEVPDMIHTLRSVPPGELRKMQGKSIEAYWKIYGGEKSYSPMARHVVDIVVKRIGHQ